MYELFKNKFPNHKICYASYYKYFKENFDLKFGQPQTDACTTCEELGVKIKSNELCESAKRTAAGELLVHKRRSRKFYDALKESKTLDDQSQAICIDFMANVSLPVIPVQDLYYYRQLTVNTFGIHDIKSGKMTCFVYHEVEGGKGANDVCSHLKYYIDTFIHPGIKLLLIFADNCTGQNKNQPIVRFLMALIELKRFESVEMLFPLRGHSFMPCDRDFSIIKKS